MNRQKKLQQLFKAKAQSYQERWTWLDIQEMQADEQPSYS